MTETCMASISVRVARSCSLVVLRSRCRRGAGAVARPWRAGARARDLAGRQARGLRQLRHLGDPLVARAQRRRAGAALPRRRGERGRAAAGRPRRHRRRGRAASRSGGRASRSPTRCCKGHTAPIVALAVSPDGATLASASWDRTVRLWPLAGGAPRVLEGHQQNVNGVAFTPDGSAWSAPATTRRCASGRSTGGAPTIVTLPTPLNAVAVAPRRRDRRRRRRRQGLFPVSRGRAARRGRGVGRRRSSRSPCRPTARCVAAAGIRGSVAIIDRATRKLARTLVGPGPAGLVGGVLARQPHAADRRHRPPDPALGRGRPASNRRGGDGRRRTIRSRPMPAIRGAEVFRACVACHTLTPDEGNRAGPTLAGIFGRRIATLPGYNFSDGAEEARHRLDAGDGGEAVRGRARRPTRPAPRCRSRRIGSAEDREALVRVSGEGDEVRASASARARTSPDQRIGPALRSAMAGRVRHASFTARLFRSLLALAQIILGRAQRRARRRAVGIEVLARSSRRRGSPRTS